MSISRNISVATNGTRQKESLSTFINGMVSNILVGEKKESFVTAVVSAVKQNPAIETCDRGSIVSAALQGNALNLSPSPILGQFYMVPYEDRKTDRRVAQFQIGYKGYIQLAIRSGQYRRINVLEIREGELLGWNPMTENISVQIIENDAIRTKLPVVGYYATFELVNGFCKAVYWSKEKMEEHAKTYSKAYRSDLNNKQNNKRDNSFWSKNFDEMAYKTLLRHLLSKWGVMSIDMQNAIEKDMSIVDGDAFIYADNDLVPGVTDQVPALEAESKPEAEADPVDEFFNK